MGLIGLLLVTLGTAASIIGLLFWLITYPTNGIVLIMWYDWLMMGVLAVAFLPQIWAWISYFTATMDPNAMAMFRLWRIALISGLFTLCLLFLIIGVWVTIALVKVNFLNQLLGVGLLAGGFGGVAIGFVLTFFLRDLWYNYDERGDLQSTTLDWFGTTQTSRVYGDEFKNAAKINMDGREDGAAEEEEEEEEETEEDEAEDDFDDFEDEDW